jgi:hypothetical protein
LALAGVDEGNFYLAGSTMGSGTANDWTTIKYNSSGDTDAEVVRILIPVTTMDTMPFVPKARIRNNSSVPLDIPVTFKIFKDSSNIQNTLVYFDTLIVNLSGDSAIYDVPFDTFYLTGADTGQYYAEVSVSVLGDQDTSNDTKTRAFLVRGWGGVIPDMWEAMAPIPPGLSLKNPKSGSCITELGGKLYFLKASNTQDFHIFTPGGVGTWISDTMPLGIIENGDGKRPKKGAAITAYQQDKTIYVLRGNNTVGFWKYRTDSTGGLMIGWSKMKNIPEGLKRSKGASGLATFQQHGEGFIFTMKGSKTDEFYIYSIAGDTWHKVSSPPPGQSGRIGYQKGSCLTYDGNQFMYVLKGNYGDLFKYSVNSDSWHELRRYDYRIFLNHEGKKRKVKDGSGLVYYYYDDNLYLLKGSNTNEFWRYETATDTWIEMGPSDPGWYIPTGSKKVKAGGCLTKDSFFFYAVRGANTPDFFRHGLPGTALASIQPSIDGAQENKSLLQGFSLKIIPNPAIKVMAVRYNLPAASPVSIKLYNITGALVKSCKNTAKDGVWLIDAKSLSSGVYILRFDSGQINITRKVVLEK